VLGNNLTASGNCLVVAASQLAIDLKNHTDCTTTGNSGTGLVFDCPGNVTNFVAKNNPHNLEENGSAKCANLNTAR